MPRPKLDREPIFKMFALNWEKKKIKKETGLSERAYFMVKVEYDALSTVDKDRIKTEATQEEKAKERFEDYEFVQKWIAMMQSEKIRKWKERVNNCRRIWEILDRKNPEHWTYDDIKLKVIPELRKGRKSIFNYLVFLRSLRPDFKDGTQAIKTKGEKGKVDLEWRIAFKEIVKKNLMQTYFEAAGENEVLVRNHVEWGCREGISGYNRYKVSEVPETEIGGILGVRWEDVDWENATIDIYETKTGGGFKWLGCPMKLFGDTAYNKLREYWEQEGKPTDGRIFKTTPDKLEAIYVKIRKQFKEYNWSRTLRAHFDRKLHASLLKAAKIPLEVVAGEAPHGIVGVGWEDLTTLKKFYTAFADEDIANNLAKARSLNL